MVKDLIWEEQARRRCGFAIQSGEMLKLHAHTKRRQRRGPAGMGNGMAAAQSGTPGSMPVNSIMISVDLPPPARLS